MSVVYLSLNKRQAALLESVNSLSLLFAAELEAAVCDSL